MRNLRQKPRRITKKNIIVWAKKFFDKIPGGDSSRKTLTFRLESPPGILSKNFFCSNYDIVFMIRRGFWRRLRICYLFCGKMNYKNKFCKTWAQFSFRYEIHVFSVNSDFLLQNKTIFKLQEYRNIRQK